MNIPLFYDERNIYWVLDTLRGQGVEQYLQEQKFDAQHINEVFEICSRPYHPAWNTILTTLLAPYVDLSKHHDLLRELQKPQGLDVREYILEKSPHMASLIGPSFQNVDVQFLTLMWDLSGLSPEQKHQIDTAGSLNVLYDDALFENTIKSVPTSELFVPILYNAVHSPWSTLENLAIVLQYAPKDLVQEHLRDLIRVAGQKTRAHWPNADVRSAEYTVDALLPYVDAHTLQEWIANDDIAAEIVQSRQTPNQAFEHTRVIHMFREFAQQLTTGSINNCFDHSHLDNNKDPIRDRKAIRDKTIEELIQPIAHLYENQGIAGVQDSINSQQLTSEHINAGLYHALNKGIPMLANIVLKHIDWDNQFTKESLRLAAGKTSSDSKQAMVQQMIVKKEAQELNGRLSAEISHIVERNTTEHTRKM